MRISKNIKKYIILLSIFILIVNLSIFSQIKDAKKMLSYPHVKNQLFIKFKENINKDLKEYIFLQLKAVKKKEYKFIKGLYLIEIDSKYNLEEILNIALNMKELLYAEPNYIKKINVVPNDTYYNHLWGMKKISAEEAWERDNDASEIIVGVLDSGIKYDHSDLKDNMWINESEKNGTSGVDDDGNGYIDDIYGYDFVNNDSDPMDDNGHGTHVSGTIGAVGNNSNGVTGICWKVKLMALKIGDSSGSLPLSAEIEGIHYGVDNGAKVLNMSFGGPSASSEEDAIKYANSHQVLCIAAAGNENNNNDDTPAYPACYDVENIIAVGASDEYDYKANFSNYGKNTVDLFAPGVNIYSTTYDGDYGYKDGTSMATPHVTGAVALVWSYRNTLDYLQIKERILKSVDKVSSLTDYCVTGGRLNLNRALEDAIIIKDFGKSGGGCASITSSNLPPSDDIGRFLPYLILFFIFLISIKFRKKIKLNLN